MVMVIDSDEYLDQIDIPALEQMIRKNPDKVGRIKRRNTFEHNEQKPENREWINRIFSRKRFHYEGRIHEQVVALDGSEDYETYQAPVTILHSGYDLPEKERKKKARRHSLLTYLAFIICGLTSVMLYKTSLGMNIRAVGENPNAAASVGVSVLKIKYTAIAYSGLMAGFGGAFMSMSYAQGWSLDMVAGRGFIALAAQAMGGGECLGGMLSSLVFGFAQALGIKFSAVGLDSNLASPIPYAVTIIGLVIFSLVRRSRAKKLHSAAALK